MALIVAPTPHDEFMCGVQFINGEAESGKASTLNYFRAIGYDVLRNISDPPDPGVVIDDLPEINGQPDDLSSIGQSQED